MKMEYINTIATGALAICAACTVVGSFNMGAYDERKSQLINKAIGGETTTSDAGGLVYRCTIDKIGDMICDSLNGSFASRLAEKRFKAGNFDKVIKKYKSRINSQGE